MLVAYAILLEMLFEILYILFSSKKYLFIGIINKISYNTRAWCALIWRNSVFQFFSNYFSLPSPVLTLSSLELVRIFGWFFNNFLLALLGSNYNIFHISYISPIIILLSFLTQWYNVLVPLLHSYPRIRKWSFSRLKWLSTIH